MTEWLQIAKELVSNGEGVFIPKKPFPRRGMKKNHGTTTLTKPNFRPSKNEAFIIS